MRAAKSALVSVVCASLMVPALPLAPASSAPLPRPGVSTGDGVTLVGRRGRHRRHRSRGRDAAGIIGAIIAGTLIAAAVREGRADAGDLERCDEDFPDFDYESGTYINRYGEEEVCPYLY